MMKMKVIVCVLIFAVLVLAGCGNVESVTEPTAKESIPGYDPEFVFDTETTDEISATSETEETPETLNDAVVEEKKTESTEADSSESYTIATDGNSDVPSSAQGDTSSSTESTKATAPVEASGTESETTAYEQYNAMSAQQQEKFVNSFESITDFIAWYNAAKAEYEALHPDIEIGDGVIDIGDLVGDNG